MKNGKIFLGYEGMYKINKLGQIQSFKRKKMRYLNPFLHNSGYKSVNLTKNGKRRRVLLHRLIAEIFIPNPVKHPVINHIDGNRLNNSITNLEWCTQKHNVKESFRIGRIGSWSGRFEEKHNRSKPILQCDKNGSIIKKWSCAIEVQRKLGFKHQNIRSCCSGKRKTAYGYIWRDINEKQL